MQESQTVPEDTRSAEPARPGFLARRLFGRRRRFIIDARLQGALLASFLAQLLIFTFVLVLVLFLPPILAINFPSESTARLDDAAEQMLALDARFWPALGAALVLIILLAIRTSHRVAGPLYRFRRVFEALLRHEDPGPVRLREKDCLKREAEFLDRVVRSVVLDRERLADLESDLRVCLNALDSDQELDTDALRQRLASLVEGKARD